MKIIVAAIAFTIAVPAAAQTAPAPQGQHQGHDQHQGHGQHQQHGQHQPSQPQGPGDCCADRNGNGRMDCCENMAPPAGAQPQRR